MLDQNEAVAKAVEILSRYGYSYCKRIVDAPGGRYVWISPEGSGYDMKLEPTGVVCVWYFEPSEEYSGRMSYEDLVDWLPGALEDELIREYGREEKQGLRKMRREYV